MIPLHSSPAPHARSDQPGENRSRRHFFSVQMDFLGSRRRQIALKSILLTLLVLAGKWSLIERFGGEVPFADQWSAEGEAVYLPILRGEWTWNRLIHPWNEHRIVPSRILSILLFRLTGRQWDPVLELAVSAVLHAILLGGLGAWLMRHANSRWHPWICLFVALIGILPFAHENTLWGFQTSFYFLLLFSLLSGWGLLGARAGQMRWCVGLLAGVCATFSLGSGGLVGAALLPVLGMRMLKRRRITRSDLITAGVAVALTVMAWLVRVDVAGHVKLASDSWADFCVAMWRLLAWPISGVMLVSLIVWMPFGIVSFDLLRRQTGRLAPLSEGALFLAGWVVVQMMAIAWFRGASLVFGSPASRYLDILAIGLAANFAAIILLNTRAGRNRRWLRLIVPTWAFVVAIGIAGVSAEVATDLLGPWRLARHLEKDRLVSFLRVGDRAALQDVERWDRPAMMAGSWIGPLGRALPPALQVRPPDGFGFLPGPGWEEGGFGPTVGTPGGYAGWGNRPKAGLFAERLEVRSTFFSLTRGAVAFSYVVSADSGRCVVEFLTRTGEVGAACPVLPSTEVPPPWQEVSLRVPVGEYQMRIAGDGKGAGFAITAPREMSVAGYYIRHCLNGSDWLFVGAGLSLVLALFGLDSDGNESA
ncbi:MAG TPA: hypothetical protein VGM64_04240 [Lacunisphaera sp.]|jgi:hypothetical protein